MHLCQVSGQNLRRAVQFGIAYRMVDSAVIDTGGPGGNTAVCGHGVNAGGEAIINIPRTLAIRLVIFGGPEENTGADNGAGSACVLCCTTRTDSVKVSH